MIKKGLVVVMAIFCQSCSGQENSLSDRIKRIQQHVDSSESLYQSAILDVRAGISAHDVVANYQNKLRFHHQKVAASFDSITQLYTKRSISESDYQFVMRSMNLDSVKIRVKELEQLGVRIPLD